MYATVSEILAVTACLNPHTLLNPGQSLRRPIRAVECLPAEDCPLSPDTLLILDQSAGPMTAEALANLLAGLEHPAAGLILPAGLLETGGCEQVFASVDTPVIEVPAGRSALFLSNAVLKQVHSLACARFNQILDINISYAGKSLKGEGLQSMVQYFKEIFKNPVAVYDENFDCIIATDPVLNHYTRIKGSSKDFYLNNLYFTVQRVLLQPESGAKRECSLVFFPISYEKKDRAYLAVFELNRELSDDDYMALEIAATAILMEMKHRLAIKSIREKNINSFIYDLIYQMRDADSEEEILREAELLGILPDCRYAAITIDAFLAKTSSLPEERSLLAKSMQDQIFSFIGKYFHKINGHNTVGNLGKSIIVIYSLDPAGAEPSLLLKKHCQTLTRELRTYYEDCRLAVGIGNIVSNIREMAESYQNSRIALNYGKLVSPNPKEFVLLYENASILKLVSGTDRETLEALIPAGLKAIKEYDEKNSSEFLPTLSAYLSANGNARAASEALFIHYKTMLYRLERISGLFHINLDNPDERLDLGLGIKILEVFPLKQEN